MRPRLLLACWAAAVLAAVPAAAKPPEDRGDRPGRALGHEAREHEAPGLEAPATQPDAQTPPGRSPERGRAAGHEQPRRSADAPEREREPGPARAAKRKDVAPAPRPVEPAPAAPTLATVAVAPQPVAGPATAPVRARTSRPARRRTAAQTRRTRRATRARAERAAATARRASRALSPRLVPLAAVAAGATPADLSALPKPSRGEPRKAEAAPEPPAPLTRTVVQVVEKVPEALRVALAVLALAGLLALAASALAAARARRSERARRALAADVGLLQSALLPELPGRIGGTAISAAYRPAEGPAAGGDFHDAFPLDEQRTCIIVGDISGHGRDVVPLTALVRYTLRAYLEAGLAPRASLAVAATVLQRPLGDLTATVLVAVHDAGAGTLAYACAGHPAPVILGAAGATTTACSSPPIGAGVPTGRRQSVLALPPGAAAVLHTDGLHDVQAGGRRLGPDPLAGELRALGPELEAQAVIDRLVAVSDAQPDDMLAVVVRAAEPAARPAARRDEEVEVDAAELEGGRVERLLRACELSGDERRRALAAAERQVQATGSAVLRIEVGGTVAVAAAPVTALPAQTASAASSRRPASASAM